MLKITWKKYYSMSFIIILAFLLNFFYFHNNIAYLVIGLIYLLFFSIFSGNLFFPKFDFYPKFVFGVLSLFSLFAILGSIFYYSYKLSNIFIIFIIILFPIIFGIQLFKNPYNIILQKFTIDKNFIIRFFLVIFYFIILFVSLKYLNSKATLSSINTPWKVISVNFFILYFVLSLLILFISYLSKSKWILTLLSIHFFFSFSIISIIYQLGFGYDPFLHQASEKLMFLNGVFFPKPFYYIGQYSIVVILAKIFNISVVFFDKFLLIFSAALFLPTIIYLFLKEKTDYKKFLISISISLFLLIPYSDLTYTTPQAIANLFLIILIFLSTLLNEKKISIFPLILIALAIFFIHPISGIPAIIFLVLFLIWNLRIKIKKFIFYVLALISCFAMPIAFLVFNYFKKLNSGELAINYGANLLNSINPLNIFYTRFINIYDLVYLYAKNINFIIFLCAIIGLIIIIKQKQLKNYIVYVTMFFVLMINYLLIINYLKFPFLSDFASRIFNMAFYFLFPILFVFISYIVYKFFHKRDFIKIFLFIFFAIFLSICFYISYPRSDKYENFHGYSVSSSHYSATHYIENNFKNYNYIVLSDQSTGAALISRYGFKKYYNGEFYYSLPTNIKNNIYSDFLEMTDVNSDKQKIATIAANKAGVDLVIVVLNSFWKFPNQLIENHKASSNNWTSMDNGNVYIFEYYIKR